MSGMPFPVQDFVMPRLRACLRRTRFLPLLFAAALTIGAPAHGTLRSGGPEIAAGDGAHVLRPARGGAMAGMFRDGGDKPLWTVAWPRGAQAIVPRGGAHLIRKGGGGKGLDEEAYAFFRNGKLLRSYRIRDLLTTSEGLLYSPDGFSWLEDESLDEAKGQLHVRARTGDRHVFDIDTGLALSSTFPPERDRRFGRAVRFDIDTTSYALIQPQGIVGMSLPPGSEIVVNWRGGGRIEEAILSDTADYLGIPLPAGTRIALFSRLQQGKIMQRPDQLGELWVAGIERPDSWRIGALEMRGRIDLEKRDGGYLFRCFGFERTRCRFAGADVAEARFRPDWTLQRVSFAPDRPARTTVAGKTVRVQGDLELWRNGRVRSMQPVAGQAWKGVRLAGERMGFWSSGEVRELSSQQRAGIERRRYCRDGRPARAPSLAATADGIDRGACADGSIVYVRSDLLCTREGAQRPRIDLLDGRPPGRLAECDDRHALSHAAGDYKVLYRDVQE